MQHRQFGAPRFLGEHFVVENFVWREWKKKKKKGRDFDDTRSVAENFGFAGNGKGVILMTTKICCREFCGCRLEWILRHAC